jgi:cytochrome c-type biogenesis protein CcmF
MTAELGASFLIVALLVTLLQTAYLFPSRFKQYLPLCFPIAIWLQTVCVCMAFVILVSLRIDSDFSVINVALHSNISLPLLYKIVGTWGNHEGSMLLWVVVVSVFGLAFSYSKPGQFNPSFRHYTGAIQAALAAGVLLFILLTSNPFARQFPVPAEGQMLNPILQDIALALHPPLLYLGYVGFSLVFSLAAASMITGQSGREFAAVARPWVLIAWTALTFGIGLGSWWAYRELGWGGFWFWDPVENASLLPWLAGTALLHSTIVLEKRGQLTNWVWLLSILTFGLSLLGTFLVRSGALISVHSFASDPARGLFILIYIVITMGGALLLFALRARGSAPTEHMAPLSREGMIVWNNLFFLCACATVLLGTLYPLFAEWISGSKLTVGAPYFNATFIPLMAFPIVLAGIAPFISWKEASIPVVMPKIKPPFFAAVAALVFVLAWVHTAVVYSLLGIGLGVWLLASSFQWLLAGWKTSPLLYVLSVFCSHTGVAVFVLGITGTGLWQQEVNRSMATGEQLDIAGYSVTYVQETMQRGGGYDARRAELRVEKDGKFITTLLPEYRHYDIRRTATSEVSIHSNWRGADLYAAIGESNDTHTAVRLYYNPLVQYIWIGCILMVAGGLLAFVHSRRRQAVL